MNLRILAMLLGAIGLASCTSYQAPSVTADHPASPEAVAAPLAPASSTLAVDKTNLPSVAPELQTGMEMTAPAGTSPGMPQAGESVPSSRPARTVYTCPMHPEVLSDKPGRCPKCGMALVRKEGKNDVQ